MMTKLRFNSLAFALLALSVSQGNPAQADDFPNIKGKWKGSYKVAFPSGHSTHANSALDTVMELEVYKQEGNLIWVTNKWKRVEANNWITEYGTGSFDMEETDEFVISEEGPSPEAGVNTGSFIGEYDDGNRPCCTDLRSADIDAACYLQDALNAAQIQRYPTGQDPEAKVSCHELGELQRKPAKTRRLDGLGQRGRAADVVGTTAHDARRAGPLL